MKVLGVIPARGGSKGIPKKNIKLLNGIPLIVYTIKAAQDSFIDHVVVTTDCQEIAEIARLNGVDVLMREESLSKDDTPTLPVIQDALAQSAEMFDAIVTLQPTSPLRTYQDINQAIKLFSRDPLADSLVSVIEVPHQFSQEKIMRLSGKYLSGFTKVRRRQEVDIRYARNGAAIYITKSERLSEYIFGGKIIPYIMPKINSFDIDELDDWEIVEKIIK